MGAQHCAKANRIPLTTFSIFHQDFRRDMMKRLRRQSIRAGTVGNKLSLGSSAPPAAASRSRSVHGRRAARSMQERRAGTIDLASRWAGRGMFEVWYGFDL